MHVLTKNTNNVLVNVSKYGKYFLIYFYSGINLILFNLTQFLLKIFIAPFFFKLLKVISENMNMSFVIKIAIKLKQFNFQKRIINFLHAYFKNHIIFYIRVSWKRYVVHLVYFTKMFVRRKFLHLFW
jgi:hypothetical protein